MALDPNSLHELQEITLWHRLKQQVFQLQAQGRIVSEQDLIGLQKFCFSRNLFSEITRDPLVAEIPLALLTDFSGINLVTFQEESWTHSLAGFLKGHLVLDLELAVAETFEKMVEYEERYAPGRDPEDVTSEDNDEELYAVVRQYNDLVQEQGRDYPGILKKLYKLKGEALIQLLKEYNAGEYTLQEGSRVSIDFSSSTRREAVASLYTDFCSLALDALGVLKTTAAAILDMDLNIFFGTVRESHPSNQSISDFIDHEHDIQQRYSKLLTEFQGSATSWRNARVKPAIQVCDLSPFAFLSKPFPEI